MEWSHGYNVALGYTYGYYREVAPSWIDFSLRLSGRNPINDGKKKYLELGCGQGYNLILHAAMHQHIEFFGIDFNPLHIAHARDLANNCGLKNIHFEEADFLDLAKDWPAEYGQFHYAALHGIYSWVSASLRLAIVSCLKHAVLPGGVVYLSYNTLPGWTSTLPMQYLLRRYEKTESLKPLAAIEQGMAFLKKMNDAGTALFKSLPHLGTRLEKSIAQDKSYLVQEYLHDDAWYPLWFGQVASEMSGAKLSPIGTATFPEFFLPQGLPEAMRKLVEDTDDMVFRQELIDCCINQSFRRDIFMRGEHRAWPMRQSRAWADVKLVLLPRELSEEGFKFITTYGELSGKSEIYQPILDMLSDGPKSFAQIKAADAFKNRKMGELIHALSFLLHASYIGLYSDDVDVKTAARANRILAAASSDGAPYNFAACARSGQAMPMKNIDFMFLDTLTEHPKADENILVQGLLTRLTNLGRSLAKDGQALSGESAMEYACSLVEPFLAKTLPALKRLGGW